MDIIFTLISIIACLSFVICFWLIIQINSLLLWNKKVTDLLSRTFKQYYKTENIEPIAINWGIDLVWNPGDETAGDKKGFVSVFYGADSGIDTPLKDVEEADELASLFIPVIEKYLNDKTLKEDWE